MWIRCDTPTIKIKVKSEDEFSSVFGADFFLEKYPEILTTGIEVCLKNLGWGKRYYVVKDGWFVHDTQFFTIEEFGYALSIIK